ncbi:hypothetical protein VTL71DRAFT_5723 [Oculimacula yallundae]|uniref:F-box domain-containing protein n=1 Tax=Oculimacula yallundae TaxID=86028 RepID=A0ABR4BYA3_9HELO
MCLSKLPSEMLIEIFKNLDGSIDRASVSQTCQQFYNIAEPILYSSFTQNDPEAGPLFIRSILQKPHRANYVKSFKSRSSNLKYGHDRTSSPIISILSGLEPGYIGLIANTWPDDGCVGDRWLTDFYSGQWTAITCVILSLLPNLEELVLLVAREHILFEDNQFRQPNCYPHILQSLAHRSCQNLEGPSGPPKSLRRLTFEFSDKLGTFAGIFRPFDYFCGIKDLTLVGTYDRELFKQPNTIVESLERLSLRDTAVPSALLVEFLPRFSKLKGLEYSSRDYWAQSGVAGPDAWLGGYDFTIGDFVSAIEPLHERLEELVILTGDQRMSHGAVEAYQTLGSLQEFTRLRQLESTECLLLGHDKSSSDHWDGQTTRRQGHYRAEELQKSISNLPNSLETLVIQNCRVDIYDWLNHLLEQLESNRVELRALRNIRCVFLPYARLLPNDTGDMASMKSDCSMRAQTLGIDFTVA